MSAPRLLRTPWREHASSILVAGLSSAFGVGLLQVVGMLTAAISGDEVTGSSRTVGIMLSIVAAVFIVIAVYVGTVVTANTFSTIIAGRTRQIALLRLLGATARSQRLAIAREGLAVGVLGSLLGAAGGSLLAGGIEAAAVAAGLFPDPDYGYLEPLLLLPVIAVVLTTWLSAWAGSRRVLVVTPLQALGGSEERGAADLAARPLRTGAAVVLLVLGSALLVLGLLAGLVTPLGVLIGVAGGVLSFTGIVLLAERIMPPALRLVGRLLGPSAPSRLAAENALRHPERSSRATIGLVIGVTLITMFGVAMTSFEQIILAAQAAQPETYQGIQEMLHAVTAVFSALIGFSALIAAVGLASNLALNVLQRRRELGLLRAVGLGVGQLRAMILGEAVQLTTAALLLGLLLGVVYGWIGAQSLLGSMAGSPGIIPPGIPWGLVGILSAATALLAVVASWAPSRRAARVSPIAALAVD